MNVIASLIQTPCTYTSKFPFTVDSYSTVMEVWKLFRQGTHYPIAISQILSLHLIRKNHIILYNSNTQPNALLLCFINGRYMNFLIPNDGLTETCVAIWFA